MNEDTINILREWAETYNDPKYFCEDPIVFPRQMAKGYADGTRYLADVEIAAVIAAHLAWGRRSMIVRDCTRAMDEMEWRPYDYVMAGCYRDDAASLHRTVRWSEFADICGRLRAFYCGAPQSAGNGSVPSRSADDNPPLHCPARSLEELSAGQIRTMIYGRKPDPKAANKKINMMRRWMVRNDGRVDLGLWKHTSADELVIPLDVHVHTQATALGLTIRKSKDIVTAMEITDAFREIFPGDPCKGDFALFGYGVTH